MVLSGRRARAADRCTGERALRGRRAHKTVPHEGLSKGEVRKRAKQVAEGQWAAAAVNNAIAAVTAATTAAIVAATSAAAMSSGS